MAISTASSTFGVCGADDAATPRSKPVVTTCAELTGGETAVFPSETLGCDAARAQPSEETAAGMLAWTTGGGRTASNIGLPAVLCRLPVVSNTGS